MTTKTTTTTNSPKGDEKRNSSQQPLLAGTPTSSMTNASTLTAGITATGTTTITTTTGGPGTKQLCVHCQTRNATKDCIQTACTLCCRADASSSSSSCPKHAAIRAQRAWRQQVLQGQTTEQILAAQIRKLQLPKKNRFRESAFVYSGDTVVIWNVRQYHHGGGNPKWRDDARRRAKKRAQIIMATATTRRLYCSRKRFRKWVQDKYQEKNGHSKAAPK